MWSATQIQTSIWATLSLLSLKATAQEEKPQIGVQEGSSEVLFGCICPEFFTSPNALQALVSNEGWFVRPIRTESLAKENFPNHRLLSFESVFQIATRATFLKYMFMCLMHRDSVAVKYQAYGWQIPGDQDRKTPVLV